ncbi:MAG: class I SAM-dependent methyltransferase [Gammaproteobacteria bacterium]|nr:class I SAM-dependent methyltransferase [Gammaproteobacteria bacterium]
MKQNNDMQAGYSPHPVLDEYYSDSSRRRQFVSTLFDDTARYYEWIIRAMSFGSGEWYRKVALRRVGLEKQMKVLDVATGTGPVARSARAIVGETGEVVGLDRSFNMLLESGRQAANPLVQAGAESLPFPSDYFDLVSMGYALRHVDDLKNTFAEYARVTRPGGRLLILEVTRPTTTVGFWLSKFYLRIVIPAVSAVFMRDRRAGELMRYYWDTIEYCVPPEKILAAMAAAGLGEVKRHRVFGIFSEYTATVPART